MKPHENQEIKKECNCGPECNCGCNEGKECRCGNSCGCGCKCNCGCHEHGGCKCNCGCRSCSGKIIALLIFFLAGIGFNELLHGCFGRCHNRDMRAAAMMPAPRHKMPAYGDADTVVIINTDGHADVQHAAKCGCGKHNHHMKHHQNHHSMQPDIPNEEVAAEK